MIYRFYFDTKDEPDTIIPLPNSLPGSKKAALLARIRELKPVRINRVA